MIEELARHRCVGDDGSSLTVVEYVHIITIRRGIRTRRFRGAAWWALLEGEKVRYLDPVTFEVINSGELLLRCSPPSGGSATIEK